MVAGRFGLEPLRHPAGAMQHRHLRIGRCLGSIGPHCSVRRRDRLLGAAWVYRM